MKKAAEYLASVKFSLSYAFRFVFKDTLFIMVLVAIAGILPYGSAYLLGKVITLIVAGVKSGTYDGVWYVLALYATISVLPGIIGNLQFYIARRRRLPLSMEVDLDILRHRERMDIANYEDPAIQDLMQRTFRNASAAWTLGDGQFDVLRSVISLIFGTILAVHFNPLIYVVVIVTAIPGFITDIKYSSRSWSIWAKDSPEQRRLSELRQHVVVRRNLIETKLFQTIDTIIGWMRKIQTDFNEKQLALEKSRLFYTSSTDIIALLGFIAGLFLLFRDVTLGRVAIGNLVYMMGTLSNVRNAISSMLMSISNQYDDHLIVKDLISFINTKPVIIEAKRPLPLRLTAAPEIVFENVGFKYPHASVWSLRHVTLTLSAGQKIGLVGNNGAGKTTLVKLLCRIYDPTEGRILVNGVDLREISTNEWWSYLAVMFQDYSQYDFPVKDAISIGRVETKQNMTRVREAAETSQAHEFITEWKDGYNQQLGVEFGGKEPSKGQWQKLSIAKTLYRRGFLTILDEPTASVDAESEAKIFDSLENLSHDMTALLISHDFSTISECDTIFVLDKGTLKEHGDHKTLMSQKGLYAELYNLQAKRFKK